MKICILHLSDLHISSKEAICQQNISALVSSLYVLETFDGIILAISGDIAGHGYANEYKFANRMIGSICSGIQKKYNINAANTKVLAVPGNHDMDKNISPLAERTDVENWYKEGIVDNHVEDELDRMRNFYSFAGNHLCFLQRDMPLFTQRVLSFHDSKGTPYYIEANLFNSALFSGKNDNGLHYITPIIFDKYDHRTLGQLVITIMHHSPDWFILKQKHKLNDAILSKSDLVFYGHEHYEASERVIRNEGNIAVVQAGGSWWEKDFSNSAYYAGTFDTATRQYRQYMFKWNEDKMFYEHSNEIAETLQNRYVGTAKFTPCAQFLDAVLSEDNQGICDDFSKYFVFPTLYLEESGEYDLTQKIESEDDLVEAIIKTPQIIISGRSNSGKTTLLRKLFLILSKKYTVLFCGIPEISGKMRDNIIRENFREIYGKDQGLFSQFEQQDRKEKVILIDDSHLIKPDHLKKLLNGLSEKFSHIVIVSEQEAVLDVHDQVRATLGIDCKLCRMSISKFYANRRYELIKNVVAVLISDEQINQDELVFKIDHALSIQTLSFKLDPDFIVKFAAYYCAHSNELQGEKINVFSKVFEASIELSIRPYLNEDETIGQIKTALSEVAYYIHVNHNSSHYPIAEAEIESVVRNYVETYDEPLTPARFLLIVTSANLLTKNPSDLRYRFRNKDYLAYFAASGISRHYNEEDIIAKNALLYSIENSCFSINSTILKYIAYSTENIKIIKLLIDQAVSYVGDWEEFSFSAEQFDFLRSIPAPIPKAIGNGERKKELDAASKREQELDKQLSEGNEYRDSDVIETISIYDYDEEAVLELGNRLLRALLQMNVVSSSLPVFSHLMTGEVKRDLITALYSMPQKVFYQWASFIDNDLNSIIDEEMERGELLKSERDESIKKARNLVQRISINFLLSLYYTVACNAAEPSTMANLTKDAYVGDDISKKLERIMFYEEVDDWSSFIREVEEIKDSVKNPMVQHMICAMVQHMLIWSPKLPYGQRDHLIDIFKFEKKNIKSISLSTGYRK